ESLPAPVLFIRDPGRLGERPRQAQPDVAVKRLRSCSPIIRARLQPQPQKLLITFPGSRESHLPGPSLRGFLYPGGNFLAQLFLLGTPTLSVFANVPQHRHLTLQGL
ncbi:hypothetical protein CapIbe_010852, partial [Capra ibex]